MTGSYGEELILDLHGCNVLRFNRIALKEFFGQLCKRIDMVPHDLHFWDDVGVPADECQTEPHAKGTSAVQFILTSTIVVHTLDLLAKVFINIFSCKPFDTAAAEAFCVEFFNADTIATSLFTPRL